MADFTPWTSLAGGALIGLATVLMLLLHGRIAGVSGIAARLLPPANDGWTAPRLAFLAGLAAAPVVWTIAAGRPPVARIETPFGLLALAGLLVGFGAVLGNGCTSGHGVCGLSRLSMRSAAATATFMAVAVLTVFLMRRVFA